MPKKLRAAAAVSTLALEAQPTDQPAPILPPDVRAALSAGGWQERPADVTEHWTRGTAEVEVYRDWPDQVVTTTEAGEVRWLKAGEVAAWLGEQR